MNQQVLDTKIDFWEMYRYYDESLEISAKLNIGNKDSSIYFFSVDNQCEIRNETTGETSDAFTIGDKLEKIIIEKFHDFYDALEYLHGWETEDLEHLEVGRIKIEGPYGTETENIMVRIIKNEYKLEKRL